MQGSAFLLIGATMGMALASCPARAAQDCASLANLKVENTNLLSATEVPAAGDLPAYCRVLGYVRPAINFEVRLPVQGWNGKFYMVGCGGFCGTLDTDRPGFTNAANYGLRRNYAVVAMDSGHWGTGAVDGRWAMNNPVAQMDWGQRAVTEAARVAGIGHVAPHDLRRSVAGALEEAGTPIEKISRLLRHSNVAVNERYLSRLPKRNEGGVLMSDLLGLEPTGEPDWVE